MSEAEDLWKSLDLESHDQVTDAVLIAKVVNFETGEVGISMSATDGVDWVIQFGMINGALGIMNQAQFIPRDDQ